MSDQNNNTPEATPEQPASPQRRKLVVTCEYDPSNHGSGYMVNVDPGFPIDMAIAILEKVKTRFLVDQLETEARAIAAAMQKQIVPTSKMPPTPHFDRSPGRSPLRR